MYGVTLHWLLCERLFIIGDRWTYFSLIYLLKSKYMRRFPSFRPKNRYPRPPQIFVHVLCQSVGVREREREM